MKNYTKNYIKSLLFTFWGYIALGVFVLTLDEDEMWIRILLQAPMYFWIAAVSRKLFNQGE